MENAEKFEQQLLEHLGDDQLERGTLKRYSRAIAGLRKQNFHIDRIWRYGQPPRIDGFYAQSRISVQDVARLGEVVREPGLNRIIILPMGIPFPEWLDVRFKIGEEVQYGG